MNTPRLDLLGDPLPEPLPEGQQFFHIDQLVGHTIKAAFDSPDGHAEADIILVTETNCWIALRADEAETPYINVVRGYGSDMRLSSFVSASELLRTGCIGTPEFNALFAEENAQRLAENTRRAKQLREQADRLEAVQK